MDLTNYPAEISRYVQDFMIDMRRKESLDLESALALWSDRRPNLVDHAMRLKVDREDWTFRAGDNMSLTIEYNAVIVIADRRGCGTHPRAGTIPVRFLRPENWLEVFEGSTFTVALLNSQESAKIQHW